MHVFNKLSLTYKLPAIIVALALIAAGATAALVVYETSAQIHDLAEARLENNVAAHKEAITAGIIKGEKFLHSERGNPSVQAALRGMSAAWRDMPGDAGEQVRQIYLHGGKPAAGDESGPSKALNRYDSAHETIDTYLREMVENQGFYDLFMIDLQGNVVYSATREDDFGANVASGPLADTGLGEVFAAAQTAGEGTHFSDIAAYGPSDLPSRFTATAVVDEQGQTLGVLAIQSANELNAIVQYNPQLGETGTSFLIGEDLLLRTDNGDEKALVDGDDDPGIKRALAGETGLEWITDHTGTEILSAYTPITFGDVTWALLSEQHRSEIFAPVNRLIREVLINLLVAAVIISGVGVLVARSITRPLNNVGATMAQVAQRQFEVEIPATNRGDEIGSIAKALASFRNDLAKAELLAEEQRKAVEERAVMEAEQARVVEKLSGSLSMLAEGDLTMRIDQPFAPEYETLRGNFNDVVTRLEEAISTVVVTVDSIRNDSIQVSQAADELSHRTENQAAALEESAASLEELTSSVKAAASTADKANKDVDAARKSAEDSGRIVRDAVEAMSEIEKSSKHISQIIGVIDDIAFQTNLLALNAGVEAARAGDAGRGFAVVASEVRALAQRSSDAAKEIKDLISTSSQHVGRGVELVRETGRSLETIVGAVSEIAALIGAIANSAREQSVGLTEINTAVSQLDQVTQQNAAMVEESTAASHAMKSEAESLATLVGQFKARAGDAPAGSVKPTHRSQVKPGRKAASPKPASAPLPVRANGSPGGGREKQDEWQDF